MEMNKREHKPIYQRLLADDAFLLWLLFPTKELDEYWNRIMQENTENKEAVNELKTLLKGMKVVEKGMPAEVKKELWLKIEMASSRKKRSFRLSPFLRYAAVFLLALATSVFVYMNRQHTPDKPIDYQSFLADSSAVGIQSGNVLIVLADNQKIEVEETTVELMHDAEGKMSVNSKVIETEQPAEKAETELNQLYVPYGRMTHIVMSDGTKIWVNSGSRVIYPPVFAENKREIYVEGEVYLEVVRNEKSPFIVKTEMMETTVLGTSFNVSAYKNDENQSVVLVAGSVSVKGDKEKTAKTIQPSQKYVLEKNTHISDIQTVDVFDHICWKFGFLSFQKEKLSDVLKKLERFYNVRIDYEAPANDHTTLSGKLDLKENISETLQILSITSPIEYEIQSDCIKMIVKP
jgi:ferric-dicitrate binding protein FerR (iron transport regulator)